MVPHAPVTGLHLADGFMTVEALAEAAQKTSDNVAANLLIGRLGGPQALSALFRAIGDEVTRVDRIEPEMNLVPPGEQRDTTTPRAIASSLSRLMHGSLLGVDSRAKLRAWMIDTQTGLRRLRAGFPPDWIAGDKTGTGVANGMSNKHNDVAIAWPQRGGPLVVAAYYEAPAYFETPRAQDDAVLAEVGRVAAAWHAHAS
jgi:beta-lactamase class A